MKEELFIFHLIRLVTIPSRSGWIVSRTTVEIATDDASRTAEVILKNFPGWELEHVDALPLDTLGDASEGRR